MEFFKSLAIILNEMSPYILLGFIFAGLLHVFIPRETMARHLAGNGWRPVLKAALFGIPLPLCSCGVLPTAVSLRRQGASTAASTSFLIATPQTGVDSIAATYSLLGLPYAIVRPVAALAGAMVGGAAVGRWGGPEKDVTVDAAAVTECDCDGCSDHHHHGGHSHDDYSGMPLWRRLVEAVRYGMVDMVASVGRWLVIGLIIAAAITVFVPDSLFLSLSRYPLLAMLVMVAVAVPMYICATGSIPIALSLMLKGLSPGTAFVLLMAGPAANFASVMVLSRTNGRRATAIYLGSVVVTAVAFGLLIDYLLPTSWFMPTMSPVAGACHGGAHSWDVFETVCSGLLVALLAYAAYRQYFTHSTIKNTEDMTQEYHIEGMACAHCQATVRKALEALEGVKTVDVNLSTGVATVQGEVAPEAVRAAVERAGFNVG